MDLTALKPNIQKEEKNVDSTEKQNLNFPCTGNYLQSIYIVLGVVSNLEML